MIDNIIYTIRVFVTIIVLAIWSVIGLLFWTPLLTRMIAWFCSMITISTFRQVDIKYAQARLNFSIEFYIIGFVKILDLLKRKKFKEVKLENNIPIDLRELFLSIIWDVFWTLIFWCSICIMIISLIQNN
jgi:hypothetical protein